MAIINKKATFSYDIRAVWGVVVSLENYLWRSDLGKIQILGEGKEFVEYTKDGYPTTFTITALEPFRRYEFDMENSNMKGHWTGLFSFQNGKTTIDFTEDVSAKKLIMKPFISIYLKKQQSQYVEDLRKELERKNRETRDL